MLWKNQNKVILKKSIKEISLRLDNFTSMIDQVKDGSKLVQNQAGSVTKSSKTITEKLDKLYMIQNRINSELTQMNSGIKEIKNETDALEDLSRSNYKSGMDMKVQIKKACVDNIFGVELLSVDELEELKREQEG